MSAPNQLSFLPDDYLARKAQRRTNVICATLFLIVVGAIAGAFVIKEKTTRELVKRRDEVFEQYSGFAKKIEQVKVMQEKQRRMAHQAEVTASLLEKVARSYLLAEFTKSLPPGVSLIDLSLESHQKLAPAAPAAKTPFEQKKSQLDTKGKPAAPPPPQAKQYDVAIKLTGVAHTDVQVAQFISKLSQSRLLSDVNLVIVDQFAMDKEKDKDKETVRKFQLDMMLNPNAVVEPPAGQTRTAAVDLAPAAR